jgi:hypothetical protein
MPIHHLTAVQYSLTHVIVFHFTDLLKSLVDGWKTGGGKEGNVDVI